MEQPNQAAQGTPARSAPDRAAVLAELEALPTEGEPSSDTSASDAPAGEGDPTTEPEPAADGPAEDADTDAEPTDADDDSDEPDAAATADESPEPADPKLAKNLEAIQRAEKRSKEAIARERGAVDKLKRELESEWAPRVKAAEEFAQLRSRAAYDPASVLEALGVNLADDGELIARAVFARSKAAAANPQTREAAERALRERETSSELRRVQDKLDKLERERAEERAQMENARAVERYLGQIEKAVSDETPIVQSLFSNDRDEAIAEIAALTDELLRDTGEVPDPADVLNEFEKRERARIKKRGLDVPEAKTKKQTQTAGEKKTAKTLSNDLGNSKQPRPARKSREEQIADVRRELEEGRFEA